MPNHLVNTTAGSVRQAGRGLGPSWVPDTWPTCSTQAHSEACCLGRPAAVETVFSCFLEDPQMPGWRVTAPYEGGHSPGAPACSTSEYISPPNKSRISKRYLYTNAHSSIIHNSQWKQHKCPLTDERIRKNVVCQYSAILFSLEKEGNYDICYYIIEPCRLC